MSKVRFLPNGYAKKIFNLHADEYLGEGLVDVMATALSPPIADRYIVAQDPFWGGRKEGEMSILTNPDERDASKMEFAVIGRVQKIDL